jgi:small multidrug resistance family-3 protein
VTAIQTFALYAAASAEIAGCPAVRGWIRLGASVLWLALGVLLLVAFAWLSRWQRTHA